ncbi:MAG TPA: hypothetical protein PKB02_04630 [Anaerohalosphaeraceae bacterium]|nr:hypothetical protein [Anaerohalosphaeraceae bacterium]
MKNTGYRFGLLWIIINGALIMGNAVSAAGIDKSGNVGRIVDEAGQPVAGAQVHILQYQPQNLTEPQKDTSKEAPIKSVVSAKEKVVVTSDSNGNFILPAAGGIYKAGLDHSL